MPSSTSLLLLAFGFVHAGAAFADEDAPQSGALMRAALPGAGANDAPRLIRNEPTDDAARSLPGLRGATHELSYRWWRSSGRADLGLGLGTLTYGTRPTGVVSRPGSEGASNVLAAGTVLTVGMRYRTSANATVYADASGVRGHGFDGSDGVVGKVGIELKAAESRFGINYGGLGLRLSGETRMTVRIKRGGVGVFMRSSF